MISEKVHKDRERDLPERRVMEKKTDISGSVFLESLG